MIDASVIVSYIKSEDTLPILLKHLEAQDYPRDRFEVILVNGDDYYPRVSEPRGQMIGVAKAKGPIIFFTNSDRYPYPEWISHHMKHYPQYDLVAGNVVHHVTRTLENLNFGNISMKREVLDGIPLHEMPSQHDTDFAFRFIKQTKFKGIVDGGTISEPENQRWNYRHQFLMARNIMVLRKRYRLLPPLSDFNLRMKHPALIPGTILGLISSPMFEGLLSNKIVNAHV